MNVVLMKSVPLSLVVDLLAKNVNLSAIQENVQEVPTVLPETIGRPVPAGIP